MFSDEYLSLNQLRERFFLVVYVYYYSCNKMASLHSSPGICNLLVVGVGIECQWMGREGVTMKNTPTAIKRRMGRVVPKFGCFRFQTLSISINTI